MKKISLLGSYSGNNKGDLAIVCAIVKKLIRLMPQIKIFIPSMKPGELKKHLPKSENVTVYQSITHYLGPLNFWYFAKSSCLVYGGGGLFFDRRIFNIIHSHLLNLFIVTTINKLFFKKPIYLLSVGASSLENPLARWMTKFILRNADYISVRDEGSRRILSELTEKKIHIRYDPTFLLEPKPNKEIDRFFENLPQKETVLLCLNDFAKKVEPEILRLVDTLSRTQNVLLYQTRRGQRAVKYFLKKLKNREGIYRLKKNPYSPEEIIYLFKKGDLAITFPMHGGIFAYLGGTPAALIEYDPKVRELGKITGNELVLRPEELGKITVEMIKTKGLFQKDIASVRKSADQNFANLNNFLLELRTLLLRSP